MCVLNLIENTKNRKFVLVIKANMAGTNSYAQYMSGGTQNSFKDWGKNAMNAHTAMLVIAVILLIIAFVWLIGLSGVQTGSCTTSGLGSLVASSMGDDLTPNPTYEVISEFFIALFLILGVGMLAYVLTTKRAADKLIEKGEVYSALIVNGKKDIDANMVTEANKQQLQNEVQLLGLPVNTISVGLKSIKDKANARTAATGAYMKKGAREAADAYDDSMMTSKVKRETRIKNQTRSKQYYGDGDDNNATKDKDKDEDEDENQKSEDEDK